MQPIEETETKEHLQMEGLHFDVIEATLKSIQTRSITPIVKEELKLKIQASRLAAGKEELPKPVFKEPQKYELTEEELQRRRAKRERNRIAAEKCRRKKKMQTNCSVQELQALKEKNEKLKNLVTSLEKEKSMMIQKLQGMGVKFDPSSIPTTQAQLPTSSASYADMKPALLDFIEMPPETPATCVQTPFSGYQPMSTLPQAFPQSRRASYDVSCHVTPAAPPYRRYSADPYMCYPSTSTSWPDTPQQLCEGLQPQQFDEDVFNMQFTGVDVKFADLCEQLGKVDEMDEEDEDIELLMNDEEEALVPGESYEKIRESPSLY